MVRSNQLAKLVNRCDELQAYPATAPLASELYTHLLMLQENFTETGAQLHSRLIFLQVWLEYQPEYKFIAGSRLVVVADTLSFSYYWGSSLVELQISCNPLLLYSRLGLVLAAWMCSQNTTITVGWSTWGFISYFTLFHSTPFFYILTPFRCDTYHGYCWVRVTPYHNRNTYQPNINYEH